MLETYNGIWKRKFELNGYFHPQERRFNQKTLAKIAVVRLAILGNPSHILDIKDSVEKS